MTASPAGSGHDDQGWHPETTVVAAGRPPREVDAPLNQGPVFASTYIGAVVPADEIGYGRYGNPTWRALETAIGALDGGTALTFASGMAAAHAIVELIPAGSTVVLPTNCYLGVSVLIDARAQRDGLRVRRVDAADTDAVLAAGADATMVWMESPTNPTMAVADLPAIGAGLPESATLVVDNTFATSLVQQPLAAGADLVLHSATKFLGGHSDALHGAVVGRPGDPRLTAIENTRKLQGAIPGTMESYLVLRGMRTLAVRIDRATTNAAELALRLCEHPAVRRVRYPGLLDDPGHATAARTMTRFGSLLAIDLADAATADALVQAVRLWAFTTSLGGVESMLERRRRWPGELTSVPEGLVRLSVGIEHIDDLWDDLEQALDRVG